MEYKEVIKCKVCSLGFDTQESLKIHMKTVHQTQLECETVSPKCKFREGCSNALCQYRHDESSLKENSEYSQIVTSTPIKVDARKNSCKICDNDIPQGKKLFKCEECDSNVCKHCARKRKDVPDYFMCLVCQ